MMGQVAATGDTLAETMTATVRFVEPSPMAEPVLALDTYRLTESLQTITAVLAIVAGLVAVGVVAAMVVPALGQWRGVVHEWRASITLGIAAVSTAGSLYFSEVANYIPCTLCWYQRIAMYPIVIVAAVAMWRGTDARLTVVWLSGLGAVVAGYHTIIELKPDLDAGVCSASGPACTDVWFRSLGFATLASMAFIAFVTMLLVNLMPAPAEDPERSDDLVAG